MTRIITITSGKGGVGKTSISLNLALCLAAAGSRVCLFDADLGLANVSILTGIHPENDISAVFSGDLTLADIIIRNFQGIDIIPGSSGVEKLADLTRKQARRLIESFLELDDYDFFIFDTSAGISAQVLAFCLASREILVVVTPEPTSLTDAYALIKVLSKHRYASTVSVVINRVKQASQAQKAYSHLNHTVNRFLSVKLQPLGVVAEDTHVRSAVISQIPFVLLFPDSRAAKSIQALAKRLIEGNRLLPGMPVEIFWDKCLSTLRPEDRAIPSSAPLQGTPAGHLPPQEIAGKQQTSGKSITTLLKTIEKKVEELLCDLKDVKALIAQGSSARQSMPSQQSGPAQEIRLDFESWLKRRKR